MNDNYNVFDKNKFMKINEETNKLITKAKKFIKKQEGTDNCIFNNERIIKSQRDRIEALECQVRTLIKMVQNYKMIENNRKEK